MYTSRKYMTEIDVCKMITHVIRDIQTYYQTFRFWKTKLANSIQNELG